MGSTKITKTINEKLSGIIPNNLKVIDTRSIVRNTDKINVICVKHKLNFFPTIKNLKNYHGCPKCGYERVSANNTEKSGYKKYEDYQNNNKFIYENLKKDTVVNGKTEVNIICKKHNHKFKTNLLNHVNRKGGGCKKCRYESVSISRKYYSDLNSIINLIKDSDNYLFEYIDNKYVNVFCKKHKEWNKKKIELLKRNQFITGSACTKCSKEKSGQDRMINKDEFLKILKNKGYYKNISFREWKGIYTKIVMECEEHGLFQKMVGDILYDKNDEIRNGNYCQTCNTKANGTSIGENQLKDFAEAYTSVIQSEKSILSDCKSDNRKNKEIDIFLPEHNLGIEFNGVYYHSSKHKDKNYHLDKLNIAKEKGIELIQFWEFEWKFKKEIVKSIILSKIGVYKQIIYARKTTKSQIDKADAKRFFENNHIQGFRGSRKYIGLYLNGEIISCMSIGFDGEIIRFCNKLNTKVIGGFSKLLKDSGAKYSFVDKRLFSGHSYKNTNFKHIYDTKPNYFYYKNDNIYSRVKFQKHKLKSQLDFFDVNLTEFENMDRNGYLRIYDCGNQKWVINK